MYKRVLVPLEHGPADEHILGHVRELARWSGASVVLIHVADGWAARVHGQLKLRESEEMRDDREYIERVCTQLSSAGLEVDAVLASGDPSTEIAAAADREGCDLIAMATHGHKFLNDVVRGSVANEVRHKSMVPVLLVRAPAPPRRTTGPVPAAPPAPPVPQGRP
jgi:nucleotide-binding universal stress UspA family protein